MTVNKFKNVKLFLTFTALAFVLMFFVESIHINAQEINSISGSDQSSEMIMNTDVSLRAFLCPDCNTGVISPIYGKWRGWYNLMEVDCTHYPWGTDMIQQKRLVIEKCNDCGREGTYDGTQTQTICHGFK